MKVYKKIQTKNPSYKSARGITPVGIVVHSTGANNPNLKRYVDYEAVCGKNVNGNHLNRTDAEISMHGFIGKDKNGKVAIVQTLPYNIACWGCGKGSKGSYNYDPVAHVQFEMCEDNLNDKAYCKECFDAAVEYCAALCKELKLDPLGKNVIVSHNEAAKLGYASNHGDPEHWFSKHGYTMDKLRKAVDEKVKGKEEKKSESKNTTTATQTDTSKDKVLKAGQTIKLNKANLYISATATKASATKTGTFYIWDDKQQNKRIRITISKTLVGKTGQVTGWISVADIK